MRVVASMVASIFTSFPLMYAAECILCSWEYVCSENNLAKHAIILITKIYDCIQIEAFWYDVIPSPWILHILFIVTSVCHVSAPLTRMCTVTTRPPHLSDYQIDTPGPCITIPKHAKIHASWQIISNIASDLLAAALPCLKTRYNSHIAPI